MRTEFTPKALSTLAAPPRLPNGSVNQVRYWDRSFPGFGIRVSSTGARVWIYQARVDGRTRVWTFDSELDLHDARAQANAVRRAVEAGSAPQAISRCRVAPTTQQAPSGAVVGGVEPELAGMTFLQGLQRFLNHAREHLRPNTATGYRILERHFAAIYDKPLAAVGRQDIAREIALVRERGTPIAGNRALSAVSSMLGWCAAQGYIETAPGLRRLKVKESARERHLAGNLQRGQVCEIPLLLAAANTQPMLYRAMTWLWLLTGARKLEIGELRWSEIREGDTLGPRICLPRERTKNKQPHEIPLGAAAAGILRELPKRSEFVFPGSRGKGAFRSHQRLVEAVARAATKLREAHPGLYGGQLVEPWSIHDLRRTAATGMRQLGASLELIDAMLNHKSGAANEGTRGVYIHSDDWQARRELAEAWDQRVREAA